MANDKKRNPVIVDTDALIAVANTSLWPRLTETLNLRIASERAPQNKS